MVVVFWQNPNLLLHFLIISPNVSSWYMGSDKLILISHSTKLAQVPPSLDELEFSKNSSKVLIFSKPVCVNLGNKDASGGAMVSRQDKRNFTSEFESHWVHTDLCLILAKSLCCNNHISSYFGYYNFTCSLFKTDSTIYRFKLLTPYHEWLEKIAFFTGCYLYNFHLNDTKEKSQHYCLGQWRFLIHRWISLSSNCSHAIIVSLNILEPYFLLFCVSAGFSLTFNYINPSSLKGFLAVLSQILTPVSVHLFFVGTKIDCSFHISFQLGMRNRRCAKIQFVIITIYSLQIFHTSIIWTAFTGVWLIAVYLFFIGLK